MNDKVSAASDAKPAKGVEVTLVKDHTHAGKEYKAGEKLLDVNPAEKDWLEANGVIAKTAG